MPVDARKVQRFRLVLRTVWGEFYNEFEATAQEAVARMQEVLSSSLGPWLTRVDRLVDNEWELF